MKADIENAVEVFSPECKPAQAMRHNAGKPQYSMLLAAPEAWRGLAHRFELGARKYQRDNWMKGFPYSQLVDCLMRHLLAFYNGEDIDQDPAAEGSPHVDAILWNALILSQMYYTRKDFDDRPGIKEATCSAAAN